MDKNNNYLKELPSILDRIIAWTENCESKTSIVLGGIGVIIGILLASEYVLKYRDIVISIASTKGIGAAVYIVLCILAVISFLGGCGCLVCVLFPITDPMKLKALKETEVKTDSLIFFEMIAANTFKQFHERISRQESDEELDDRETKEDKRSAEPAKLDHWQEDYLSQIYACSVICKMKFIKFKIGLILSAGGILAFLVLAIIGIFVT